MLETFLNEASTVTAWAQVSQGAWPSHPWMVGQRKGVLLQCVSLMLVRVELLLSTWHPNADMT